MIELAKGFENKNTIQFTCTYRALDQRISDPSGPAYSVYNIKNQVVQSGEPVRISEGVYGFYFTPTKTGEYVVEFTGGVDSKSLKQRKKFSVRRISWKGEHASESSSYSSNSLSFSSSSSSSSASS